MLILFPVPIGDPPAPAQNVSGDTPPPAAAQITPGDTPPANTELLNSCHHFIVENTRTARRNLRRMGYTASIDHTTFLELNQHTTPQHFSHLCTQLQQITSGGSPVGLMSEAGVPCIADPGARIVAFAQQTGIPVIPLVGPCSIILSLMASGLNGQNFAFLGYLPFDTKQRQATLTRISQAILRHNQTQILIETPYRNNQLLSLLASKMPPQTLICVATDITLPSQSIRTLPAPQWLQNPPDLNHHYCVFLIGQTI